MSQGGGQLHGVMVGRAIGSVVVSEDAWLGRLACGCAPFICLLACQQGTQMFSTGGAGFQQEEMPSPHPPSCSRSEDDSQLVCCFFLCAGSLGN